MSTNNIDDLIEAVVTHGPDILADCVSVDKNLLKYIEKIQEEKLNYPVPLEKIDKNKWFIPNDYCPDLVAMLYDQCENEEQRSRVEQELELFIKHGMYDVLHTMKYIVDTLRANNIVWGVGRGSSVASYVLYLIGVHKIDSVKYNLPIEEFFKEI